MQLSCSKCQKPWVLSEEDAALFWPQVWCLGCGTRIEIPLTRDQHVALSRKLDRDRRVDPPPAKVR